MTSLMCFTFCLLFVSDFVYSLSCHWVCVFLLALFATPGGERLYPYLFTCHVSTGHLFPWPYLLYTLILFGLWNRAP